MSFATKFLAGYIQILEEMVLDEAHDKTIDRMAEILADCRSLGGRLFTAGSGGGAGYASHAASDFRNIVGIESYAIGDNLSELTALINDYDWASAYEHSLRNSRLNPRDVLMVFSVGGGDEERHVSPNLVAAVGYSKQVGARVLGIVGRDGGYTARLADACLVIPTVNPEYVTPYTEGLQAAVWHLLVSHPRLKVSQTKWESVLTQGGGI